MKSPSGRTATGPQYKAYQVAATCAVPLAALGLAMSRRGRRRYAERFGMWERLPPVAWWLHGASVGEVQGLLPFVRTLRERFASDRILLTATSPTGLERGAPLVDATRLLPLDASWVVSRALKDVSFDRFVISETELWPGLLHNVCSRGVPCHIINGRISDYTVRWYRRFRGLFTPCLQRLSSISVSSEEHRARFVELGVDPMRVHVTGHTKYDTEPKHLGEDSRRSLRKMFFPDSDEQTPIVVLGSLRSGEEVAWFSALERLWRTGARCKVIIAPRHAERFSFFWTRVQELPVSSVRWSARESAATRAYDVLLLDTMGRLEEAYAAADLAFVGATLVDIGGHNPLEPAMYGCPVVVGPFISVIREVVDEMRRVSGIAEIVNEDEIYDLLLRVSSGDAGVAATGEAGKRVWQSHRGASQRALTVISESEESR